MEIKIKITAEEMAELIHKIQIQPSILEKCTEEIAKNIMSSMAKF